VSLLRNPWVTGVLAAAALGVVAYQFLAPQLRSRGATPARPVARPVSSPGSNVSSLPSPAPETRDPRLETRDPRLEIGPGIDRGFVEARFAGWVNAPKRDPFLLVLSASAPKQSLVTNSPVATWKLSGIWNQEGVRLAVINRRVYGEGDEIEGYRVERIVGDEVWFMGTNGLERLGIQQHRSAAPKWQPKPPASK
jgi:hypothetical protein